ncbi:hypothetical protein [Sphingomonas sp. MMS24-J13]|uniref:hypothetical protein n=1 Tax=Sphingomonas sp. MMS24-J13 TaxID=3238686 RepID=UPI0038506CC1
MENTPRMIARAWRLNPAERGRIERLIAVEDMQHLFRWVDGRLLARIGAADRARITASGGGAYRPAADRRLGGFSAEVAAAAGAAIDRRATLDGEPVGQVEAEAHRAIARRAA